MTPASQRLSRDERLRRPADFRRVYDRRCSASDAALLVFGVENDLPYSRLGISIGRKWGGAPERNRLRRLYREAFRMTKAVLPVGIDLILIPRRTNVTLVSVKESLVLLARRVADMTRKRAPRT